MNKLVKGIVIVFSVAVISSLATIYFIDEDALNKSINKNTIMLQPNSKNYNLVSEFKDETNVNQESNFKKYDNLTYKVIDIYGKEELSEEDQVKIKSALQYQIGVKDVTFSKDLKEIMILCDYTEIVTIVNKSLFNVDLSSINFVKLKLNGGTKNPVKQQKDKSVMQYNNSNKKQNKVKDGDRVRYTNDFD